MALPRHRRARRGFPRGQALVEFALVVPIIALLLLIAIDFGRLFYLYIDVQNAAREGAVFASFNADCLHSTCLNPNPGTPAYHARQELGSGTDTSVTVNVVCGSGSCTTATSGTTVLVSVSKPFSFFTPFVSAVVGSTLAVGGSASAVIQ